MPCTYPYLVAADNGGANNNWTTCNNGSLPGATDIIYLSDAGCVLVLDGGDSYTYTADSVWARVSVSGARTNGTVNPGTSTGYNLDLHLYTGNSGTSMFVNPTGKTINRLKGAHGGTAVNSYCVSNVGTITTLGTSGSETDGAFGGSGTSSYGVSGGTITTINYALGGSGSLSRGVSGLTACTTIIKCVGGSNTGQGVEWLGSALTTLGANGDYTKGAFGGSASGAYGIGIYASTGSITNLYHCEGGSAAGAHGAYYNNGLSGVNGVAHAKGGSHTLAFGVLYEGGRLNVFTVYAVDVSGAGPAVGLPYGVRVPAGATIGGVNKDATTTGIVCVDKGVVAAAADIRYAQPRWTGATGANLGTLTGTVDSAGVWHAFGLVTSLGVYYATGIITFAGNYHATGIYNTGNDWHQYGVYTSSGYDTYGIVSASLVRYGVGILDVNGVRYTSGTLDGAWNYNANGIIHGGTYESAGIVYGSTYKASGIYGSVSGSSPFTWHSTGLINGANAYYSLAAGTPSASVVVTGNDTYVGGSAGTYPTTETTTASVQAADAATLEAVKADLKDTRTVTFGASSVTGTLPFSTYTLISGIVGAGDVRYNVDRYTGGTKGTLVGTVDSAGVYHASGIIDSGSAYHSSGVLSAAGAYASLDYAMVAGGGNVANNKVLDSVTGGTLPAAGLSAVAAGGTLAASKIHDATYGTLTDANVLVAGGGSYVAAVQAGYSALAAGYGAGGATSGTLAASKIRDAVYGNLPDSGVTTTYGGSLDLSVYVLKADVIGNQWVVVGHYPYAGAAEGTYPPSTTSYDLGAAAQLVTDRSSVDGVKAYIQRPADGGPATVLGTVTGTLNTAAIYASGESAGEITGAAAQLVTDKAAVEANDDSILLGTTILTIPGAFDLDTYESTRNTDPGQVNVLAPTAYKIRNVAKTGTYAAAPAAGTITVAPVIAATVLTDTSIRLAVTMPTNAVAVAISRRTIGNGYIVRSTLTSAGTYTDAVTALEFYEYIAVAVNADGTSSRASRPVFVRASVAEQAVLDQIADAVCSDLNDGTFSQSFTATRLYLPNFKLQEMDDLHVTVVPRSITSDLSARSNTRFDCVVDIAVQKKVDPTDVQHDCDELTVLVREIATYFRRRRLTAYQTANWLGDSNDPVYIPEHLDQMHQFTGVLKLTYVVAE